MSAPSGPPGGAPEAPAPRGGSSDELEMLNMVALFVLCALLLLCLGCSTFWHRRERSQEIVLSGSPVPGGGRAQGLPAPPQHQQQPPTHGGIMGSWRQQAPQGQP